MQRQVIATTLPHLATLAPQEQCNRGKRTIGVPTSLDTHRQDYIHQTIYRDVTHPALDLV